MVAQRSGAHCGRNRARSDTAPRETARKAHRILLGAALRTRPAAGARQSPRSRAGRPDHRRGTATGDYRVCPALLAQTIERLPVANEYDVIVIGAGTGGYVAAIRAAQLGLSVAVVEKQKALGGTCLLWGCIPTKALLDHAPALKVVQASSEWGISVDAPAATIDMPRVQDRKDKIVGGLTKGVEFLFKKNKIDLVKGTARLTGGGGLDVDLADGGKQTLRARREIVVATGSSPRSVPGIAIDHTRIITSDQAIHLKEVPGAIAIMGSGAVGVEFASIFHRFGSQVTIVELLPRLVPVEDEAVSAELEKSFKKRGISCHPSA